MSKPKISINPKIKEYLKFKGKINTFDVFDSLGITPHPGQRLLLQAYEAKIEPTEYTIERSVDIGVPIDFEYQYDTLVVSAGRRWGKSYGISGLVVGELLIPYANVILASHTLENCDIIFKQVVEFTDKLGIEYRRKSMKDRELELINGARLSVGSVENIDSKLGNYVTLLVLDEAKRFQKTLYEQVLIPMLGDAAPMGRSILISSPEDGWFRGYFEYGQSKDEAYAKIWSINSPTMVNPAISKAWIEHARKTLPPDVFEQEIEGKFTAGVGRVFTEFTRERNIRSIEDYPHLDLWVEHNVVVNTIDSGYQHYFSSLHFTYVEEIDTYIFVAEYNKNKTVTSVHAENIKAIEDELICKEPELRFADPAASQQLSDLAEYGLCYNFADKNLRETIQFLNALCFQTSEITGESRLIVIEERCPELCRQLLTVKWKENQAKLTMENSGKGIKPFAADLDRKTDWDCADAARYGLWSFGKNNKIDIQIFDPSSSEEFDPDDNAMFNQGWVRS